MFDNAVDEGLEMGDLTIGVRPVVLAGHQVERVLHAAEAHEPHVDGEEDARDHQPAHDQREPVFR
ncbi:MAG: hypothetical protein R2719_03450 [Micropruina sp.]